MCKAAAQPPGLSGGLTDRRDVIRSCPVQQRSDIVLGFWKCDQIDRFGHVPHDHAQVVGGALIKAV